MDAEPGFLLQFPHQGGGWLLAWFHEAARGAPASVVGAAVQEDAPGRVDDHGRHSDEGQQGVAHLLAQAEDEGRCRHGTDHTEHAGAGTRRIRSKAA